MKFVKDLYNKYFGPKQKIEDYFVNENIAKRKGKYAEGVCIESCGYSFFCEGCGKVENCSWIQKLPNFDKTKPSILIIDDNHGMVSFLRDDIEEMLAENKMDIEDWNILEFTSKFAAYKFLATHQYYDGLNITKAIIDITYGGSVQSNDGNIRLTGVDVFREIYRYNKDLKFVFYTGNQLNTYIKSNRELSEQFKNIYHDKIFDYVLYKTSLNMNDRRKYFLEALFDIKD